MRSLPAAGLGLLPFVPFLAAPLGAQSLLPPHAEMKLVTCLHGEVWDVAVDVRASSPTFLQWHAEVLSRANRRSLLIPEGFAHGFQALSDDVEMLYCHSHAHAAEFESGLHPQDARLAITWPLAELQLSDRDAGFPRLQADYPGVPI